MIPTTTAVRSSLTLDGTPSFRSNDCVLDIPLQGTQISVDVRALLHECASLGAVENEEGRKFPTNRGRFAGIAVRHVLVRDPTRRPESRLQFDAHQGNRPFGSFDTISEALRARVRGIDALSHSPPKRPTKPKKRRIIVDDDDFDEGAGAAEHTSPPPDEEIVFVSEKTLAERNEEGFRAAIVLD